MRKFSIYMVWALALSSLTFATIAQESEKSSEKMARELLEVSGAGSMGIQVMQQLISSFKTAMPEVPQEFWDEFMADVDPNDLVEIVIPIYVKHLSEEDMQAAVTFYKTPAGQAILGKLPVITQEAMQAGQQWGTDLGMEVQKRLQNQAQN